MRTCPSVAAENTEDNLYVLLKMTFFVSRYNGNILQMRQIKVSYVLGVYLKRTCSSVTSASSALGVLNDYALYKSTHSFTSNFFKIVFTSIKGYLNQFIFD